MSLILVPSRLFRPKKLLRTTTIVPSFQADKIKSRVNGSGLGIDPVWGFARGFTLRPPNRSVCPSSAVAVAGNRVLKC